MTGLVRLPPESARALSLPGFTGGLPERYEKCGLGREE